MNNRKLTYVLAALPLVAVNAYCLAGKYFVPGDWQINLTVAVLFLVIAALIGVTKLFFDFFVTLVTGRCTGHTLESGEVFDRLLKAMLPQWIVTLAGLLISRLIFTDSNAISDLILFALAHSVYYGDVAVNLVKKTGRKAFAWVFGAIALVCWGYAIYNLVGILAM